MNGGPAVWAYWESGDRPRAAYLDLCIETIARHAGSLPFHLLGRDDAPGWLPDMDVERFLALPAPNFRSDYVRSRLLQRYGGVWIDVDTVVLGPLARLVDAIDDTGVVCFGQEHGRFFGGLCATAPGTAFADAWVEGQDRMLDRRGFRIEDLGYAGLAQDVTWHLARQFDWRALPMGQVAPVPWFQWRRFFSRLESPARILAGDPVTVVLWNAVMEPRLRHRDRDRLLAEHTLLSRLLRIGLGRSTPAEEEDAWTRLAGLSAARFSLTGQRIEATGRRVGARLLGRPAPAG